MHKWTLAVMTACSLLFIVGCSNTVDGSPITSSHDRPFSTGAGEDITIYQSSGSVAEYCSFLMSFLDSAAELAPDSDPSDILQEFFEESRRSGEWNETPLDERHRIEEAFARAESGRC